MHWEQKLQALNALAECNVKMRKPGDWYVCHSAELKTCGAGVLRGEYGNGASPEEAVNNHWSKLTELPDSDYIVIGAFTQNRKAFIWNGFMWQEVTKETP